MIKWPPSKRHMVESSSDMSSQRKKHSWLSPIVQSGDMKTTLEKGEYSCFEKYESLRLLFSNSNPKEHQQLSAGGIQPDVALKWTMSFFHNVIESVYNSYAPWKKNFFVWDPNIPIQCHNESVIYLCLLTSAIHACASFFMDVGLHPKCPDELAQAIKNIKMKRDGENLSLVTFYTKAHSLSMNRSKETEKVFKRRFRILSISVGITCKKSN